MNNVCYSNMHDHTIKGGHWRYGLGLIGIHGSGMVWILGVGYCQGTSVYIGLGLIGLASIPLELFCNLCGTMKKT
ncbi:hypothetical protein V8C34DRAFT_287639 [Trichoderma compactum]